MTVPVGGDAARAICDAATDFAEGLRVLGSAEVSLRADQVLRYVEERAAEREAARAELDRLRAALGRVTAFHRERPGRIKNFCVYCHDEWPCRTIVAASAPPVPNGENVR